MAFPLSMSRVLPLPGVHAITKDLVANAETLVTSEGGDVLERFHDGLTFEMAWGLSGMGATPSAASCFDTNSSPAVRQSSR